MVPGSTDTRKNENQYPKEKPMTAKYLFIKSVAMPRRSTDVEWRCSQRWEVTLRDTSPDLPIGSGKWMTLDFYMGSGLGGQRTLFDVLYCLLSDAHGMDYYDFEEWAENYGYDTDSRKAEDIYNKCKVQTKRLRDLLDVDRLIDMDEDELEEEVRSWPKR